MGDKEIKFLVKEFKLNNKIELSEKLVSDLIVSIKDWAYKYLPPHTEAKHLLDRLKREMEETLLSDSEWLTKEEKLGEECFDSDAEYWKTIKEKDWSV